MLFARSLLFTTLMMLSVIVFAIPVMFMCVLPYKWRYAVARAWADLQLWMLRTICRLDYRVEGTENIPEERTVVLLKHQSAWETIAQLEIFPYQTWVLKRELMWLPFLGWGLAFLKPIAINRAARRKAVKQVVEKGMKRLEEGLWVMIFPEGTRMPPGKTKRYGLSGAVLARAAGQPILPVAHNGGDFWPRRGLIKRPGTVTVRIGKPIPTEGRNPEEINRDVQNWIEAQMEEISEGYREKR